MSENHANINWFPGHMAKTRRKIAEILPLIDAVCEVVDARIPISSRNPELPELVGAKPLIVLLNKCDMADPQATAAWIDFFKAQGVTAIAIECKTGKGFSQFKTAVKTALADGSFDTLRDAVGTGDAKAAFEAAHALKGVLGNLSLTPLYQPASEITELLRAGEAVDVSAPLTELLAQRERLQALCGEQG